MKLYELTDKGRALLVKPRHVEPTNWEHCCSCCTVLEKENKELKGQVDRLSNFWGGGKNG